MFADFWVTDDLTPAWSKLAYLARTWAKGKEDTSSWTMDGKIFLKNGETAKPKRVLTEADIPRE